MEQKLQSLVDSHFYHPFPLQFYQQWSSTRRTFPCLLFSPHCPSRTHAIHHSLSHSHTFSNALTLHRSFTSFTKHFFTKSTNSADHPEEEKEGGSPSHTLSFIVWEDNSAYGFLSASSINEMPNAHTSLFISISSSNTSGAKYHDELPSE